MKNIETYKKALKNRRLALSVICSIILFKIWFTVFFWSPLFTDRASYTSYVVGFLIGLELVLVWYLGYLFKVLKDERLLKKQFLQETDERYIFIKMKSGIPLIPILSVFVVGSALVVGYFNYTACLAMIGVVFAQLIVAAALKIYWSKKI